MQGALTLGEIAQRLGGRVAGDPATRVRQVGSLEHAQAGEISFLSSARFKARLAATRASAVSNTTGTRANAGNFTKASMNCGPFIGAMFQSSKMRGGTGLFCRYSSAAVPSLASAVS